MAWTLRGREISGVAVSRNSGAPFFVCVFGEGFSVGRRTVREATSL